MTTWLEEFRAETAPADIALDKLFGQRQPLAGAGGQVHAQMFPEITALDAHSSSFPMSAY